MNVLIAWWILGYCQVYGTFVLYHYFNDKSYIFLYKNMQKMETINKNLICYDNGAIVCELNNYVGRGF